MILIIIIFKFVFKNICEKKFRTFLIIFSIMVTSALIFASTAISGTIGKMYEERMKLYYGSAEIMIYANERSKSFPSITEAQNYRNSFEYIIGTFNSSAVYKPNINESVLIGLVAINYKDLEFINPFKTCINAGIEPFNGRKIIIGKNTADKYNLSAGEYIDLEINNKKYKYLICAIAYSSGYFVDDGINTYAVVPKDTISSLYNAKGKEGTIYLKTKNAIEKKELINQLAKGYPRHTVTETISEEEFKQQSSTLTITFLLMTVIVFLMSVFIIYSSFKVLTTERLPVIGTLRSIGATRKITDLILFIESIVYSIIGGLLGCGLGIVILYIMSYLSKPVWIKDLETSIEFSVFHIVLTFLVAVFLGFVSSIIPIFKISKIPVKDIILNSIEKKHKKSKIKLLISIVAISMAVVAPQLIPSGQGIVSLVFLTICMIMSIVSIILLVPYLTNIFVKIFERIYFILFHNEGVLAAKNLKDNKSTFTNISLLAIGISSILMINIVSFSVSKEVGNVYSDLNFDIWLTNYHSNRNFEKILNTVDGVESICGVYEINNVEIMNKNSKILVLNGIDKNTYSDFWNIHIEGNENELLKDLDNGRNLLLSKSLKEKFGIEKGGLLELNMKSGIKSYKIIGFFNTLMNNGNYAVISDKYLKADAKLSYYSQFYIKTTKTPTEVTQNIKNRFPRISMYISTMDEMERLNVQSNDQMFTILNGFSVMSLIIGIFGVLNNFILSFIERKRWLAVFRSLGMNKHQIIKMLFIESLTCGLIGGIIGAITGLILVKNVSYILVAINLPVSMHLSPVMFINSILGGMLITFLANISPAIKSSRLNIIDAIKYE